MSKLWSSARKPRDTGGIGYEEIPPPFNDNYNPLVSLNDLEIEDKTSDKEGNSGSNGLRDLIV